VRLKTLVLIVVIIFFSVSCRQIFAPDYPEQDADWEIRENEHFTIYYRSDSLAAERLDHILNQEEIARNHILSRFRINYSGRIHIYIYRTAEDAGWDNVGGRAYPRTETIEVIYGPQGKSIGEPGVSAHEMAHVITHNRIGFPGTSFLSEGAAVAMDGVWFGPGNQKLELHAWVNEFSREGRMPKLEKLINDFHNVETHISYPVSGSFTQYLMHNYGVENYKRLFFLAFEDNFDQKFQEIYGVSLQQAEQEWIQFCQAY
jgi:hypothetical protein